MVQLCIEITKSQFERLQKLAHEYGHHSVEAYMMRVVEELEIEPTKEEILDDIRESMLAIKRGEPMMTIEEMWAEVEKDDDE
ncbi:MAG: hypothetical protein SFZ02_08410 [bacterium]|nr:hypothetical protein [bacterium]